MDLSDWKPVLKTLWNMAVAVVVAAPTLFDDWRLTGTAEWCLFLAAVANAFLVWVVPNMKSGVAKHAKGIVAIIVAATAVVPTLALDGWSNDDTIAIVALIVGAIVTPVIPNKGYVYARKIASPAGPAQNV
jgi:hypothetical protein